MSDINLKKIREMREKFHQEANSIKVQIQLLQTQLIQCKERVRVYEELLVGEMTSPGDMTVGTPDPFQNGHASKRSSLFVSRSTRTTKAEMTRRKNILVSILQEQGSMQPRDLLPLASEAIGTEVESHHLRAILRRFDEIFEAKEEHGVWGLTELGQSLHSMEDSEEPEPSSE
jgi:hypothetical protein